MTSPYRPEFEAALRLFARISEAMVAKGLARPVLVGGGAVEIYSNSAINTGDFDLVTGQQAAFEAELQAHTVLSARVARASQRADGFIPISNSASKWFHRHCSMDMPTGTGFACSQ